VTIPDFQSIFLPLLELSKEGNHISNRDAVDRLAEYFSLTEDEREELLPSGRQRLFDNRVNWPKTYLKKAGLLSQPARGIFQITDRGREVLAHPPEKLNVRFLRNFDEFLEFHTSRPSGPELSATAGDTAEIDDRTPEELMTHGYQSFRESLAAELLSSIKEVTPTFFERLVIDLLLAMGYGGGDSRSGIVTGKGGDEGIDGIISEDKLGLDMIYIQAKRWEGSVGRPEIQKFVGALQGKRAKKGVFITTSSFSKEAVEYAELVDTRVILIDGKRLSNLMIDHNVGVSLKEVYEIKRIDSDYFVEE
jgi:restriction system protein